KEWNKEENWASFETALDGLERSGCDGLSFVLTEDDPYVCIDLDNVKENFENAKDIVSDFVELIRKHLYRKMDCISLQRGQFQRI
ncbi:DNA primase, partial [Streptococcus equi subsp. zooepidemicus]|nr:DNA primase [Streptococcus equi subsp. zooepidemicus]